MMTTTPSNTMNLSPKPSPRIRFVVEYQHKLVPLEEIVKLGDSYKAYNTEEEIPQVHNELFQYRRGQRASWSSLPAELRSIIYQYAYAIPPKFYPAFHMKIYSGHRYLTKWWKKVKDLSLNDDDIVVQLPHLLANRFVSKQWLFETADTIAKLKNWHSHVEDKTWNFAISVCERKSTDMSTLDQLSLTICAIMLQHISRTSIIVTTGNKISKSFKMEHFEICNSLDYIQVKHEGWWDKQYWTKNQSSNSEDTDSDDELKVVTIQEANAGTDTDTSLTNTVPQRIHATNRETANALKTKYKSSIYEDDGLPEAMRASVFEWTVRNDAFKDFSQTFKNWNGPKPPYPSEFIICASCAIAGEPKRSLCFEMRIETCSRMLLKVFEQESKIYHGEAENEEEVGVVEEVTTASVEQNQQPQEQEQEQEQNDEQQPPQLVSQIT